MTKLDGRYIVGLFLVLFILKGFGEFVLTGRDSLTLDEVNFRVPFFLVIMNELLEIGKDWKGFRFLFVILLIDYLLKTAVDLLGVEKITLTIIPYLGTLGTLFIALSMMNFYYKCDNKII